MRKKRIFQIAAVALLFSATAVTSATLAWLHPTIKIGNQGETNTLPIDGSSSSGYFAYGDGSAEHPYGIRIPRHLYNLAWLQYLGAFQNRQLYFELAGDVDMKGWTLPPIGTEDNPFVSQFNGQGYAVSNLTVSNNFGDYNVHPATITAFNTTTNKQPHILGMFGVVGNYKGKVSDYKDSINELKNTGLTGITVKTSLHDSLVGLAAGYVDAEMSNVAIDTGTVNIDKTASDVSSNATTSYGDFTDNISDYTIVGYTTKKVSLDKVSDTIYNFDLQNKLEFNAVDQGDAQGWGGSINMMSMFQRLDNIRRRATATSTNYNYRSITTHPVTGAATTNNSTYSNGKIYTGTGANASIGNFNYLNPNDEFMYMSGGKININRYYSYYNHEGYIISNGSRYLNNNDGRIENGTNQSTASRWHFVLGTSTISSEYDGTTYYLYDNDGTLELTQYSMYSTQWYIDENDGTFAIYDDNYYLNYLNNNWTLTSLASTGIKISDGTNYLNYNGTLGNTTNASNSSSWVISVNNNDYISTTYNNNTYYLRNNGGTLTVTTNRNNATTWTTTKEGSKIDIYNGNYHITYDNGWKLIQGSGEKYYLIRDNNNHYIGPVSGYVATSTNKTNAVKFSYGLSSQSNSNGQYGFYYDTNRYFGYYSSPNYQVQLASDSRGLFHMADNSIPDSDNPTVTGKMYGTYQGVDYYVQYNGNNPVWAVNTNESNGSLMTIEYYDTRNYDVVINFASPVFVSPVNTSSISTSQGPDNYLDETRTTTEYQYTASNTTYYPLNVQSDGGSSRDSITNGNYRPTDSNTGYVIAGTRLSDSGSITNGGPSLIRVSQYSNSNIQNSYSSSNINNANVRTINASGNVSLTSAYPNPETSLEKYAASKATLLNVLKSSSNVYGLHFMGAQISMDHILKATNVSLLGTTYGNPSDSNAYKRTFDLPVNAIDFNLKDKGYINFFAGTYFSSDVTSFFSLHQIFRNPEAIGYSISEIKEIAEIYANKSHENWAYAYKFTDGTYSKPYRVSGASGKYELSTASPDPNTPYVENHSLSESEFSVYRDTYAYTKLFDTQWITNYTHSNHTMIHSLNQKYLYYFEIPMNGGEYCLGSVQNGTGGYLLYLDIGASASKIQRTMIAEHFINQVRTFEHPSGAAIISVDSIKGDSPTFDDSNSICIIILPTYKGTLSIDRSSNNVTITRDATYDDVAKPSYISDTIVSVVDPGGSSIAEESVPSAETIKETCRVTYYDYKAADGQLFVTVITDVRTKTNSDAWTSFTRSVKQKVDNGEFVELTSASQITDKSIVIYKYLGSNNTATGTAWSYTDIMNVSSQIFYNGSSVITTDAVCSSLTTVILQLYSEITNEDISVSQTIEIEMVVDPDIATGTYYKFNDYIFIPVVTGGSVTYVVKSIDGTKTFYFVDNTTQLTAVDQEEMVNP